MFEQLIETSTPIFKLLPETEVGNVEYKLRLDKKNAGKLAKMPSQMVRRANGGRETSGRKEAIYILGIMDDGSLPPDHENMDRETVNKTLNIFKKMLNRTKFRIVETEEKIVDDHLLYALRIATEGNNNKVINETGVIFYGPTGSGKTTLVSLLAYEQNDNGKGYSRRLSLKHEHEFENGITSDVKRSFIGFKNDLLMNYSCCDGNIEDIYMESDRYLTLDDMPGKKKYMRTTLFGILSSKCNIIVNCISADTLFDMNENLVEYHSIPYKIAHYKKCKVITLITKSDLYSPEKLTEGLKNLVRMLDNISLDNIMKVSSVTGDNVDSLISLLSGLSTTNYMGQKSTNGKDYKLFMTGETFNTPMTRNVLYGHMKYGNIRIGEELHVVTAGTLVKCTIKTIQKKAISADVIFQGETGCLQIKISGSLRDVGKSSMLISDDGIKIIENDSITLKCNQKSKIKEKNYLMICGSTVDTVSLKYKDKKLIISGIDKKLYVLPNSVVALKDETGKVIICISE